MSQAIVIGAGLAGSSAAERLAARGWTITLIERAPAPGQGASGNLAGVLRPLPSLDNNRLAQLTATGFRHAREHFAALTAAGLPLRWGQTGVLHLARDDRHAATQQQVAATQPPAAGEFCFVDRERASQLAGWPVANGGWWFPDGGWVDPASLCRANLARHAAAITTHYGCEVAQIGAPRGTLARQRRRRQSHRGCAGPDPGQRPATPDASPPLPTCRCAPRVVRFRICRQPPVQRLASSSAASVT
jgi:tRNA 5-methylaminomethyl-2-thiouridine biosynthesis bifunctional protein